MTIKRFDDYSDTYEALVNEALHPTGFDAGYFAGRKVNEVRSYLASEERENGSHRILDFGCGIGLCEPYLTRAFPHAQIIAVDDSPASIARAKRDHDGLERVTFQHWAGHWPQETPLFDIILLAGVLHHVPPPDRQQLIDRLFARLAPGGLLFLFEHNPFNPCTRRIVRSCRLDEAASLLRPAEASALLRRSGFSRQCVRYFLFFPLLLRLLIPLERFLYMLPLGAQYYIAARKHALRS